MESSGKKGHSSHIIQPALASPRYADVEKPHPRQSTTEVCVYFLFVLFTIASVLLFISAVLSYNDGDFIPPAVVFGFAVTCFALFSLLSTARCWVFLRARMPAVPGNRRHGFRNSDDFTGGRKFADVGGWHGFWLCDTPTKVGVVVNGVVGWGKSVAGVFGRRRSFRAGESGDLGKEEEGYGVVQVRKMSMACDSGTTYGQGQSSKTRTFVGANYEQVPTGIERFYQKERELATMTLPNTSTAPSSTSTPRARDAVNNTRPPIQATNTTNPYAPNTSDAQLAELARKKFKSDSKNYFRPDRPHSAGPRGRDIAPQADDGEALARSASHAAYRREPPLPWEQEQEALERNTPHAARHHREPPVSWEEECQHALQDLSTATHRETAVSHGPILQGQRYPTATPSSYASHRHEAEARRQQRGRPEHRYIR